MPDYSKGKIYKIVCNETGLIYVGSTCEPTLARRLSGHVGDYKRFLKGTHNYISSFKTLENGNYNIVLVENFSCDSKDELYTRERHYIETLDCVNRIVVGRTPKELYTVNYQNNKEKILNKNKKWYEENKEEIKQRMKKYQELNKEKLKEKKKEYREKNKDKIYERNKKYNEANKEAIKEKVKKRYEHNKEQNKMHINIINSQTIEV